MDEGGGWNDAPITPNFLSGPSREIVRDYVEKNKCWSTTFHTIIIGDADRWYQKWPVYQPLTLTAASLMTRLRKLR